jgi:hypothetical protein
MSFILSEQRDLGNSPDCWRKYQAYLKSNESKFPKAVFKLATSDWWYSFSTPKAPHDSHLISANYTERQINRRTVCYLEVVLQSCFKGKITLTYSGVQRYQLSMDKDLWPGHGDWRYDEFSSSEDGFLVHTIEWAHGQTWVITGKNIRHRYQSKL